MIFLRFAGSGGWEVRVVHCISCGSGNDLIMYWPQIVTYISNTSQHQEFQHVEGRVGIFCV